MTNRSGKTNSGLGRRSFVKSAVLAGSALGLPAIAAGAEAPRSRDELFDLGWLFHRGDAMGAEHSDFDDRSWRKLDLPHDWSVEDAPGAPATSDWDAPAAIWNETARGEPKPGEFISLPTAPDPLPGGAPRKVGPFDADKSESAWGAGWTLGGTGWYRKHFDIARVNSDERVLIRFDGAFQTTDVWLNGKMVGSHDHGHSGFALDLTTYLRPGNNVLAVRVRNEGFTSRWYNGSGIYRHVWLTRTPDVHIPLWGVFVSTPSVTNAKATARIAVEVKNSGNRPSRAAVSVSLVDPAGATVGTAEGEVEVAAGATETVVLTAAIDRPRRWSPEDPALYAAQIAVEAKGGAQDKLTTSFGIRTIEVDAKSGLRINGKSVKLKGACIHHDHGFIGSASFDYAERRKVELLKANGFNAIRCSHNLFAPSFYEVCDQLGIIVIDEMFDVWNEPKLGKDLGATRFKQKWREDVAAMVRRDRNHPSIIFWSIGNEIPERNTPAGVETAANLRAAVLELDSTRLITAAVPPGGSGKEQEPARRSLDVVGYNYMQGAYAQDHADNPDTVFMGTEQFASDIHDAWRQVEANDWLIGDFVWTAIDYLGEVGAGSSQLRRIGEPVPKSAIPFAIFLWDYPAYQSGCGEIDLIGLKKPQSFYRDVLWRRSQLELLVRRPPPAGFYEEIGNWAFGDELKSWNWEEGETVTVRAYTNGDEVVLLLDGTEIARKRVTKEDKLTAEMPVAFRPGVLTAVSLLGGKEIARQSLESVGAPAMVKLRAERQSVPADRGELAYFYADVCDAKGRRVPDAQVKLAFSATGAAQLLVTGSANPRGIESFTDPRCTSFHGAAQAILRPSGRRGEAVLSVTAPGLKGDRASITLG
jgi:Beta-galactosidase/beta-glucuronidase